MERLSSLLSRNNDCLVQVSVIFSAVAWCGHFTDKRTVMNTWIKHKGQAV